MATVGPPALAQYRSGEDVTVTHNGHEVAFNVDDFAGRCQTAAMALGVLGAPFDVDERAEILDLVDLVADGVVTSARSAFGRHLASHGRALGLGRPGCFVYWARRLVFEGAWLDQRVKTGVADLDYDDVGGSFRYRVVGRDELVRHPAPPVRFRDAAYRR